MKKPSNVQIAGICLLIGGIFSILTALLIGAGTFCIWVPFVYGLVAGIFGIVKGARLLGNDQQGFGSGLVTTPSVLLIVNIINFDMIGMVCGILALVLTQDDESKNYLTGYEILD